MMEENPDDFKARIKSAVRRYLERLTEMIEGEYAALGVPKRVITRSNRVNGGKAAAKAYWKRRNDRKV